MKTALLKQYIAAILGGFLPLLLALPVHARNGALANDAVVAVSQDSSGAIWLSNWDKLVRYRPSTVAPPVRVTNAVTNREHGPVAELNLPTSQDYLAFVFQGRSFRTRPGQMVYVYRWRLPTARFRSTPAASRNSCGACPTTCARR